MSVQEVCSSTHHHDDSNVTVASKKVHPDDRQSASTVRQSFPWVRAMLKHSPSKTPPMYIIADALLVLDAGFHHSLLKKIPAATIEDSRRAPIQKTSLCELEVPTAQASSSNLRVRSSPIAVEASSNLKLVASDS